MKFTSSEIGSKLMETITSGLYDGNINCIREYVQNCIDSKAKNIEIYFENGKNDLVIKDNGIGMKKDQLKNAFTIGISQKKDDDVGWRGIGIWSGVPSCERIVIISKKKRNPKYRIEIDNEKLRKGNMSNKPVLQTLTESTSEIETLPLGKSESKLKDQYTIIRLESILPTQKSFFNEKEIGLYLSRVVPAPFNSRKFTLAKEIEKWLNENGVKIKKTNIKFQGKRVYRPPTNTDIFHKKVIKKIFQEKGKSRIIAVGWALLSFENKKLRDPNRGIFLKKKGFTLGDENLVIKQHTGSYSQWQYGEIHIISKELNENAARNNFKYNNKIVGPFLKDVGDFIHNLHLLNQYQSSNIVTKPLEKVKEYIKKGNKTAGKKEIKKAETRLLKKRSFPKAPFLKPMKKIIDNIAKKDRRDILKLNKRLKQTNRDIIRAKLEQLNTLVENLPMQGTKAGLRPANN